MGGLLPFYLVYTATLITLNPIPLLVGLHVTTTRLEVDNTRHNMEQIKKRSERRKKEETTSLLEEQNFLSRET